MDQKIIRPQVHDIQKRFFQALDTLIQGGRIRGLKTFCNQYGLHRPKYSNIRTGIRNEGKVDNRDSGYKLIDIDAMAYLVSDYGVSADWLLLGRGGMFRTKKLQ